MEACHDNLVGGCHFGRDRTLDKVTSRYYWKNINKYTDEWVSIAIYRCLLSWVDQYSFPVEFNYLHLNAHSLIIALVHTYTH